MNDMIWKIERLDWQAVAEEVKKEETTSARKNFPEVVKRFGVKEGEDKDLFVEEDDESEYSISTSDLLTKPKEKMRRPSAAEMRKKGGDEAVSRDVPTEERLSDKELLRIGLERMNETNKERWRKAPYCWNEKRFLYEEYHYLAKKRDAITNLDISHHPLLGRHSQSGPKTRLRVRFGQISDSGLRR